MQRAIRPEDITLLNTQPLDLTAYLRDLESEDDSKSSSGQG